VRAVLTLLLVAAREREHRRARCVARLHGTRAVTMSFRFDPPLFSRNSFFLLQRAGVAEVLIESR
jgi:hypothetical protein